MRFRFKWGPRSGHGLARGWARDEYVMEMIEMVVMMVMMVMLVMMV